MGGLQRSRQLGCTVLVLWSIKWQGGAAQSLYTTVLPKNPGQYSWGQPQMSVEHLKVTYCGENRTATPVCSFRHKVQPGDDLSTIATKFGTSPDAIKGANPALDLTDDRALQPNTNLQIPPCGFEDSCEGTHVVSRGETVEQIAAMYNNPPDNLVRQDAIMYFNPDIKDADELFPYQLVKIPHCNVTFSVDCNWEYSTPINCNGTACYILALEICVDNCTGICTMPAQEPQCCRLFNMCVREQYNGNRAQCMYEEDSGWLTMHTFANSSLGLGQWDATCRLKSKPANKPVFVQRPVQASAPDLSPEEGGIMDEIVVPERCGVSQVGGVAETTCLANYTVQAGDDAFTIADLYDTTVQEIARANPYYEDIATLWVGDVLSIPPCGDTLQCDGEYFAQEGQGLRQIADELGFSFDDMAAANPEVVTRPNYTILEGQRLRVPECKQNLPHKCRRDKATPIACSGPGCAVALGPVVLGEECLPGPCTTNCTYTVNEALCCKVYAYCLELQSVGQAQCYATAQGWYSMSSTENGGWNTFCDPTCKRTCFTPGRWQCCGWA